MSRLNAEDATYLHHSCVRRISQLPVHVLSLGLGFGCILRLPFRSPQRHCRTCNGSGHGRMENCLDCSLGWQACMADTVGLPIADICRMLRCTTGSCPTCATLQLLWHSIAHLQDGDLAGLGVIDNYDCNPCWEGPTFNHCLTCIILNATSMETECLACGSYT